MNIFIIKLLHIFAICVLYCRCSDSGVNEDIAALVQDITCKGIFDMYFVLDKSSSLYRDGHNHFVNDTAKFVTELSAKFTSPLMRLSYITFSDKAEIVMPLTHNRAIVEQKLKELRKVYPQGSTRMDLGLQLANSQIKNIADKRASVIVVLTDGKLDYITKKRSIEESGISRKLGATVFTVGVSNYDQRQLLAIAGSINFVFEAVDFSGLDRIVEKVVDSSCVEVSSVDPTMVCSNTSFVVTVYGRGFNKTGSMNNVRCNFHIDSSRTALISPTESSDEHLVCGSPEDFVLLSGEKIIVQVTLNKGISFVSSNVTVSSYACGAAGVGLLVSLLFVIAALIAVMWWFWNALCCVVAVAPKKEHKELPPIPPPPPTIVPAIETRQWPAVNASFYGGRGAGGIKPVPVNWGGKGCTEGALHLERTKDAEEVAVVEREVMVERQLTPEPITMTPIKPVGCFGRFKKFLMLLFGPIVYPCQRISVRRPNRTDVGNCILIKRGHEEEFIANPSPMRPAPVPPRPSNAYLDTRS